MSAIPWLNINDKILPHWFVLAVSKFIFYTHFCILLSVHNKYPHKNPAADVILHLACRLSRMHPNFRIQEVKLVFRRLFFLPLHPKMVTQPSWLDCGVNDATVVGLIPVGSIHSGAGLNDPCGSLPDLSILCIFVSYLFMFLLPCIF